jgi:predicted type IV restriction endonuclease/predicted transport protein
MPLRPHRSASQRPLKSLALASSRAETENEHSRPPLNGVALRTDFRSAGSHTEGLGGYARNVGDLNQAIDAILVKVKANPSLKVNEENTAVVLVEPMLAALGWDPTDLSVVDRQYRVYDGTKLDYALRVDAKPTLFVEVKGLGKSLDDSKFIAQTVNYANNEGVMWCVLTNGVSYRVYKTNEPVGMASKLMIEIDLLEVQADEPSRAAAVATLSALSRESVVAGHLDSIADAVFLGGRVRTALESLLIKPTQKFRSSVESLLDETVERERLDRVLAMFALVQKAIPTPGAAKASSPAKTPTGGEQAATSESAYSREHHTAGRPMAIVELFDQLAERAKALGDVVVTYRKFYVNFSTSKQSFMTTSVYSDKLRVHFSIPWDDAPKLKPASMRDVTHVGHYGLGPTEFVLSQQEELDAAMMLAAASFERNKP